ncbi:hypothetical protein EVB99_038 [Rhizobium phage RHph_N3_19]|nr:hypothetical protein EVB99_038 [Rhizobium phage RHph_N3_19]
MYGLWLSDGVPHDRDSILKVLKNSIEYLENCDDAGSFDFEMSRLQEFFDRMSPILDENGGI